MMTPARLLFVTLLTSAVPAAALAQSGGLDLSRATLEDLMQIRITSASRKEQRLDNVPAAIYVITQDDIRRSGLRTLPELFRMVPGMQVARIDAHTWAVSVRGFNSIFSNKLLVLIDGQTIYNLAYTGVIWSAQDLLLDDIERIEVIRGPGAAIWGANAVNGIINIITKSAADTQGTLARIGGGTFEGVSGAIRHGRTRGKTAYRVHSQWASHGQSSFGNREHARDPWDVISVGGRMDRTQGAHSFLVTGNFADSDTGRADQPADPEDDPVSHVQQSSLLGRWTFARREGTSLQVQAFVSVSREQRKAPERNGERLGDVDVHYHTPVGRFHDLIVGGGYRHSRDSFRETQGYSVVPSEASRSLFNAFAQDEVTLGDHVTVTAGAKVEHDSILGWNVQPSGRAMLEIRESQHLWAAVSRALRAPGAYELGIRAEIPLSPINGLPAVVGIRGNPDYAAEKLRDAELGYRIGLGPAVAVDVTAFRGYYSGLPMLQVSAPALDFSTGSPRIVVPTTIQNLLEADTRGVEVSTRWLPSSVFSMDGSYAYLQIERHEDRVSGAVAVETLADISPRHQWRVHSALSLGPRAEFDASIHRVGAVSQLQVPAYTRADLRLEVRVAGGLSIVATGHNLTNREHAESAGDGMATGVRPTRTPRSAGAELVWKF